MARTMGATLVGMSTVLEAIAARHLDAEVLGLSLVSNFAAGVTDGPLESPRGARDRTVGGFASLGDAAGVDSCRSCEPDRCATEVAAVDRPRSRRG